MNSKSATDYNGRALLVNICNSRASLTMPWFWTSFQDLCYVSFNAKQLGGWRIAVCHDTEASYSTILHTQRNRKGL